MDTMLIGRWSDDRRTLTITESHRIADSDREAIDALFKAAETADGADWGCAFDEDRHSRAVQRAYDGFARDDDARDHLRRPRPGPCHDPLPRQRRAAWSSSNEPDRPCPEGDAVHLTPAEQGRLLLYTATLLARERHQRGVKLNVPEATALIALIAHAACEAARDGGRLEDAVAAGRAALTAADVLPEVPGILTEIQVEAVFADGSKLIVITHPLGPPADPARAPGAVLPADQPPSDYADAVRIQVTNTADVPVTVTSHFHFFEAPTRQTR